MAEKEKPSFARAVAGDERIDKIGNYQESTGGGTPIPKGEKLKDHPEIKRVQQPRDENGQFTYNAVNERPLKYGPSRGTTIPPFLRGLEMVWAVKAKTSIIYDGKIYTSGKDMTKEEFIDFFREYSEKKGFGEAMDEVAGVKRGRRSKLEKMFMSEGKTGTVGTPEDFKEDFGKYPKHKGTGGVWQKKPEPKTESTEPVKTEPPKTESKDFDSVLAKSDPRAFMKKYGEDVDAIRKIKGMEGIKLSTIVEAIGNGTIKSLAHAKQLAEEFED